MSETSKKIVSHGSIYAVAVVVRNISSLIMLPIYTQYLAPKDYGVIELLVMVLDFVAIFIGLQLEQVIFRQYGLTSDLQDRKRIINSALLLMVGINFVGVLFVMLMSDPISIFVFGSISYSELLSLFSLTLLFAGLNEVPMTFLRAQEKPWLYVIASILKLVMQISCALYFVVHLEMGVLGVIYGALLSSAAMAFILCAYTIAHTGLFFSRKIAQEMAVFSLPLVIAMMAMFGMTSVDKYLLREFSGLESVGVYALAYKFGYLLTGILGTPFNAVWEPLRYKVYQAVDGRDQFSDVFRIYFILLSVGWLGLSMFAEDAIVVMSAQEFWPAARVVPFIVMAYLFHCLTHFCNFGIMLSGKTIQMTYASGVGFLVALSLCYAIVPSYGSFGAGVAVLCAFFVRFLWVFFAGRRHYAFAINGAVVVGFGALAVLMYAISLWVPENVAYSLLCKILIMSVLLVVLWFSPMLVERDRRYVRSSVSKFVGVVKN